MNYPTDPLREIARGHSVPRNVLDELEHDGYLTYNGEYFTITPAGIHTLNTSQ